MDRGTGAVESKRGRPWTGGHGELAGQGEDARQMGNRDFWLWHAGVTAESLGKGDIAWHACSCGASEVCCEEAAAWTGVARAESSC